MTAGHDHFLFLVKMDFKAIHANSLREITKDFVTSFVSLIQEVVK